MISAYQKKVTTNLKKARGQIDLVLRMIEEGKYCMSVAQQVNAAIGLLRKTNNHVLENHLLTCGVKKLGDKNVKNKEKFVRELVRICDVTNR